MSSADMRRLVTRLRRLGWRVELSRKHHWIAYSPTGQRCVFPGTPSDHRAWLNTRAQLRRLGADL